MKRTIAKGETQTYTLEGYLQADRLHWKDHVRVGEQYVSHWLWDRLAELPDDCQVDITITVTKGEAK